MDSDDIAKARKRLENRLEKFRELEARYRSLMDMTDSQVCILNANGRGVTFSDPVYQKCQDYDTLSKIEDRTLPEAEYVAQLFPELAKYSNGHPAAANGQNPNYTQANGNGHRGASTNGKNVNHRPMGLPPGFSIALGGDVVPTGQLVEANRNFIANTRMR